MRKYQVILTGGRTRVYKARSPKHARDKYYASDSHFRTEASVVKIIKYKKRRKN